MLTEKNLVFVAHITIMFSRGAGRITTITQIDILGIRGVVDS